MHTDQDDRSLRVIRADHQRQRSRT
jgi:hypothetical protein